jgi:hypothetical protein
MVTKYWFSEIYLGGGADSIFFNALQRALEENLYISERSALSGLHLLYYCICYIITSITRAFIAILRSRDSFPLN